ncbi:MAG TPA: M48 family metalloprotease [Longimicrobium sp.]|jgi:predicted Zn-dependent protease|uniref:M48 family metalloprotease n=1 Tax=Longimicrobium sp. TaxID=2029185 RepID=UPI002ED82BFF
MIRLLIAVVGIALFITLVQSTLAAFGQARGEDEDEAPPMPERRDAEGVADWMHARVMDAFALEREGWALERAARVEARLQAGATEEERLRVAILWIPEVTAFTFGRHVYLSRRLLERVGTDEPVAFVVAHEMAHHALGHLLSRNRWIDRFARVPAGGLVAGAVIEAARLGYNVEQELDADAWALRRCFAAGYDPRACLGVLDVLEADALDRGDLSGVYGPVPADVDAGPDLGDSVRQWLAKRERGYPPLLERRQRLMEIAEELVAGDQP